MADFPDDLVPIPTQPWQERPNSLPLTIQEARTALWLENGNIGKAATRLKVTSHRFRRFVDNSPRLKAEQMEAREQLADRAEEVVREALHDEIDTSRRDSMARYVLSSPIARPRGFGPAAGKLSVNSQGGPVLITWGDGTPFSDPSNSAEGGPIIDVESEDAA